MSAKKERTLKNCNYCKKEFLVLEKKNRPGKFCSQDCQRKGRYIKPEILLNLKCIECDKEFTQPKHWKSPGKYCSIQCMSVGRGKNMRGENHPKWSGGDNRSGSHTKCNRIKRSVGECQDCGSKENLNVHHIIKVSDRPDLVDDETNIEILCVKCHATRHPEYKAMILKIKDGKNVNCTKCGKQIYKPQSRIKDKNYCNNLCRLSDQTTRVSLICVICGTGYEKRKRYLETSKFCSNKCRYEGQKLRVKTKN